MLNPGSSAAYFHWTDIEPATSVHGVSGSSSLWSEIISKYLNGTAEKQLDDHRDWIEFGLGQVHRDIFLLYLHSVHIPHHGYLCTTYVVFF
jgi:hypothetical protein